MIKCTSVCGERKSKHEFNRGKNMCRACQGLKFTEYRIKPENAAKILVSAAKSRAKANGLEFNITYEDVPIPTHCPILGTKIIAGGNTRYNSPSIDRIDPTMGYIKGNVGIVSLQANWLKMNATAEQIRRIATWVSSSELKQRIRRDVLYIV